MSFGYIGRMTVAIVSLGTRFLYDRVLVLHILIEVGIVGEVFQRISAVSSICQKNPFRLNLQIECRQTMYLWD